MLRRPVVWSAILLGAAACALLWLRVGKEPGSSRRPVIFVGLDGADWELLDDYLREGRLPTLAGLVREGRHGVLETEHPPLSPLLWTTMMTGVSPLEHRILDFTRFAPGTGRREPITSDERRAPAIWNMTQARGLRAAVFGIWATYPAEEIDGLLVSDRLFSFQQPETAPPPGIVWPSRREAWAREALARTEAETGYQALQAYLPWLDEAEYQIRADPENPFAHPVSALRRILIETAVYHRLATESIEAERPDLAIVYFQGTDAIGHVFAPFAPPRQAPISAEDFGRYSQVPALYFEEIDRKLADYRRLAGSLGASILIASDHGFFWKQGRPAELHPAQAATAARWHRREGMYVVWGPGIAPLGERGRGGVAQVCATLLALLDLPPGRGLKAPPLAGIPPGDEAPFDYAAGFRPAAVVPGAADPEAVAKLRALGYLGANEAEHARTPGESRTASSYNNEGLLLKQRGDTAAAEKAFLKALETEPDLASAQWNLSDLLFGRGRDLGRADDLLIRALAGGLPDGAKHAVGRAIAYQRTGEIDAGLRLLDRALQARTDAAELWLFRGRYRLEKQLCQAALLDLERAAGLAPLDAGAHAAVGLARLCLGDSGGAERALRRSLELDPDQPQLLWVLDRP